MIKDQRKMNKDEFYIGYQPQAPRETGSFVRKIIIILSVIICAAAVTIAFYQKKFSPSIFEYGTNTSVEGYYFASPVPHLAISLGLNTEGIETFQNVLLVGNGKEGAEKVMEILESREGKSFVGSKIELRGFLIYGSGKALLQVSEEDNRNMTFLSRTMRQHQVLDSTGAQSVRGEIVDPKCYFGVMKPAEGKSHRSCAIRCIAGGIPAVLHKANSSEYFIIVNERMTPINQDILDLVGDHVELTGEIVSWNDWKMLKVNSKAVAKMAKEKKLTEQLVAFEDGITKCSDLSACSY